MLVFGLFAVVHFFLELRGPVLDFEAEEPNPDGGKAQDPEEASDKNEQALEVPEGGTAKDADIRRGIEEELKVSDIGVGSAVAPGAGVDASEFEVAAGREVESWRLMRAMR
jgi:hypothetical protein